MKNAFTMIELMFVIVIIGILSAIALPRFASTKKQADIAAGRADVSTIRSAIVSERQTQLVKGINTYIPTLSDDNGTLFTGDGTRTLLMYGIASGTSSGKWAVTNAARTTYTYTVDGATNTFTYTPADGKFICNPGPDCTGLTK